MRSSPGVARGARRDPFASAGFDARGDDTARGVARALLVAKQTGVFDVRGRGLCELPAGAFDPESDPTTEDERRVFTSTIDFGAPEGAANDPNWWETHDLTSVVASRNRITRLPESIAKCVALQKLDLSRNLLSSLPGDALLNLPLRLLDVSHNDMQALPDTLPQTLVVLKCGHNKNMWRLPDDLGKCFNLAQLEAPACNIQKLPDSLGLCVSLVELDLSKNKLETIPDGTLSGLRSLQDVDISSNRLHAFPGGLAGAGDSLRILNLRENHIVCVPNAIERFAVLNELYIGSNRLSGSLPDAIGHGCLALVTLDVSRNSLTGLPASLANLKKTLAAIDAAENDLQNVAPEIGTCVNLRSCNLNGNPLRSIRQSVITGPVKDLLKLLKARLPEVLDGDIEAGAFGSGGDETQVAEDARRAVLAAINKSTVAVDATGVKRTNPSLNGGKGNEISLNLRGKGLKHVPSEAWASRATRLDLGANALTEVFPETIRGCPDLVSLFLDDNNLTVWPLSVPDAPGGPVTKISLRALRLDGNAKLSLFLTNPSCFLSAPALTSLDLSKLKSPANMDGGLLAPLIGTLEHLRWEKGSLAAVPKEVYVMKRLKTLRLSDNEIEGVQPAIANLQNLDELDLRNNVLAKLPPDLGLCSLRSLQLEGNPLRSIRRAILDKGAAAVLAYLKDKMPA